MTEEALVADDASHYEISLTAGQAFVAFVLLLLSLAASFAFGLMIGRGTADERLVVKHDPPVINEGAMVPSKAGASRISELVPKRQADAEPAPAAAETPLTDPVLQEGTAPATPVSAGTEFTAAATPAPAAADARPAVPASAKAAEAHTVVTSAKPAAASAATHSGPVYAQLISTTDQKAAESLAAKLIDHGFPGGYVDRLPGEKGMVFRVRVKFSSETEARAALDKLKEFSKDVWIPRQ
jgi:cell division septation protein DedD